MTPACVYKPCLALALALAAGYCSAADPTLSVTGTIQPAACTLGFPEGDRIDFGGIHLDARDDHPTALPPQYFTLSVECQAPTRVALSTSNGTPHGFNGADGLHNHLGAHSLDVFSIRTSEHVLAAYLLRPDLSQQDGDSAPVSLLEALGNFEWMAAHAGSTLTRQPAVPTYFSWGDTTAQSYTRMTSRLGLYAVVNSREKLPAVSDQLLIDEAMTFKLTYL
ncbi:DUF1120 domain-containing protein [Pseudomonas sp. HR96]|uniref:DUF1120 domain-containing protein n=1 Tax=Pseudomonas sp. HR96 TaxID=1027966 RepID=UPI002A76197C|nr:DUF1120 domain-containing protein [Pseudomonas sp. HR96]WPP01889.1 DUF1120 domain-containing protein [Pseudomonas sp. HR96]